MSAAEALHGRYRLVGPIGDGGSGTVVLADDLRLPGRQCAVKILAAVPLDAAGAAAVREQIAREASLLARLDHPALPKVTDCFESDGRPCVVMDYVPGQDLRALVVEARRRGRFLDEAQVVRWAETLCDALTYLHGLQPPIIHRDVKPANVKLAPDGQVRLVDFGLATAVPGDDASVTVTVPAGGGSRPYQPLEQYGDGTAVDARSDVYALGATLYHLLTGRAPASAQERFLDATRLDAPRVLRPDLSPRTETAVMAALALHPGARPPSAEALRWLLVAPAATGDAGTSWRAAFRANAALAALVVTLGLVALGLTLAR